MRQSTAECSVAYSGSAESGYTVTNSHTPVKTENTPETGDHGNPVLWIVLMGFAGTAFLRLIVKKVTSYGYCKS